VYLPVIDGDIALRTSLIVPTSSMEGDFLVIINFVVGIIIICTLPEFFSAN
jgi:hypothetical protein